MGRRNFSQEPVIIAGDPGSDYCYAFAPPDKTSFGKDVSFALVAKKVGIYHFSVFLKKSLIKMILPSFNSNRVTPSFS